MTRLIALAGLLFLLAAAVPAADLNGDWKGSFDFQGTPVPLTLHLKTSGATLTGAVEGLPTTPADIHEGKIQGDTITFWLNTDYEGTTYKLVYKGQVSGDQIRFTFGTEDESFKADFVAKRA